ncbi:recombinase family protein [Micromonospora sp. NPDC049044]|uniref:recombinase family protein n=1 Tax=Micromonospora sp. NPDC049044 TaxID=3154827 RepID=UPI0033C6D217
MRVLRALRLSREREESTSFPVQRATIDPVVQEHGGTIVDTAEDMDVSAGTTSPFDRPSLGPWLTDPELITSYDAIAWSKLDRAIRNMMDLNDLAKFAITHKKLLIFCTGPGGGALTFDFRRRDPVNNIILQFLAFAAELEWISISDRNKNTSDFLRSAGRYRGGPIPYGYMKTKNPKGDGWILVHDPAALKVVKEAVRRATAGETAEAICSDFTARGILTPRQHARVRDGKEAAALGRNKKPIQWQQSALFNDILRSRNLLGETEFFAKDEDGNFIKDDNGKRVRQVLRDGAGLPVMRGEPLISQTEWTKLQQALEVRSLPSAPRRKDANRLLGVAKCIVCESNYYLREWTQADGKSYGYYYCKSGCTPSTKSAVLDELLENALLKQFGNLEIHEKQFIPGEDHSDELLRVDEAIRGIREEHDLGLYEGNRQGYLDRLRKLIDRKNALEAMPSRPASWEYVPVGTTYRQAWEASDVIARRKILLDAEVIAYVGKVEDEIQAAELMADRGKAMKGKHKRAFMIPNAAPVALLITMSNDIEKRLTGNKAQEMVYQ